MGGGEPGGGGDGGGAGGVLLDEAAPGCPCLPRVAFPGSSRVPALVFMSVRQSRAQDDSSDNFFSLVGRAWGGRLEPSVEVSNQWRPVIRVTSVVEYLVRRKNP